VKRVPEHLRKRVYNRGDPLTRALLHAVRVDGGCWRWTGALTGSGYGHLKIAADQWAQAHRLLYGELIESVPDNLQLDHLCRNRWCVNPCHLEPVTPRVNAQRSAAATVIASGVCLRGHPGDHRYRNRRGRDRGCLDCRREKRQAGLWA